MDKNIYDFYKNIETIEDFKKFLQLLLEDFEKNKGTWENDTLPHFIEGMYSYIYLTENNEKKLSWKGFAEMLLAAKVCE